MRIESGKKRSRSKQKRSASPKKDNTTEKSPRKEKKLMKEQQKKELSFRDEKLTAVERDVLTPMTADGLYYILEPTLS